MPRYIALFTVDFGCTKRGDELRRKLIQRILRLPNGSGLLFNFKWRNTMRDGADYFLTISYNCQHLEICPGRALEHYIAIGTAEGWNMHEGYLLVILSGKNGG